MEDLRFRFASGSEIRNFIVYSQKNERNKIEDLFFEKVGQLDIDFLHEGYKKISKSLKQYFLSEYNIEPFIKYLKSNLSFEEAIKVYKYLDEKKPEITSRDHNKSHTITTEKIRQKFKADKLIHSKKGAKYFPSDVTWKEEKSNANLFALSQDYPNELHNFFVQVVQVSQTKDIRQIIDHINDLVNKDNDYFDLLIDLNDLIDIDNEIDKYNTSYSGKLQGEYNNNIYENAREFILKKEQIFILDNDKKNGKEDFYFNDLNIEDYDEELAGKIFSVNKRYPTEHYSKLIDTLKIKRLSKLPREYSKGQFPYNFSVKNFRSMLHFAYDLLFTKFPDEYKKLQESKNNLLELNEVEEVKIDQDIIAHISVDGIKIEIDSVKYYIENKNLYIVDEKYLFKIISEKIGSISDKDIKDFHDEVIKYSQDKETYYDDEYIKEKQNFPLHISDIEPEEQNTYAPNNSKYTQENDDSENDYDENEITETKKQKSEEERRSERKSGVNQIGNYERNPEISHKDDSNIEPSIIKDTDSFQKKYYEKQNQKKQELINSNPSNISEKSKNKFKNDVNKTQFEKIGDQETKNKFRRKDWYLGQCQICGFTFKNNEGKNHYERFTWTDFKKGNWTFEQKQMPECNIIDESNSLCLCSRCHSILKHGGQFKANFLTDELKRKFKSEDYTYDNFIEDIAADKPRSDPKCFKEHVEWEDMYFLSIELNNNKENIYFTEEHLIAFFIFLKS